jgi:DNA (cytosine-5)-methyltransferase 1
MTVGSLFAGIGGLDLGAERAGFDVIWQCEKDDYCTKVLNKHWPDVPVYNDVQTLYTDDGPGPEQPDILCGGFPCQDISIAGHGEGLNGERSGLWWEYFRLIRAIRPRYAVVENVPALVRRGLRAVLGALTQIGYDAQWQIVSAAALGAPHVRERLFLLCYANSIGCNVSRSEEQEGIHFDEAVGANQTLRKHNEQWRTEPDVDRVADGFPNRVDRLKGLGNAVVPQVAEFVFDCIKQHASDESKRLADRT